MSWYGKSTTLNLKICLAIFVQPTNTLKIFDQQFVFKDSHAKL